MSKHSLINQMREIFPAVNDFHIPWADWVQRNGLNSITIPALNITEDKSQYTIRVAAPGLEKDYFDLSMDHNVLTITSSSSDEKEEKNEKFTRKEYNYTNLSRSITLPVDVKEESITADYDKGILTIVLPKNSQEKPATERKITIR